MYTEIIGGREMKNRISASIVIGIILIIVALGYIGNVFEVWSFTMFFPGWWTLFIIVPSALGLIHYGFKRSYAVWLVLGGLLLIWRLRIIPAGLSKLIVPLLLLAVGMCIIFRGKLSGTGGKTYPAVFTGRTVSFNGKAFEGACCIALFGGVDLLLTNAEIVDGSVIEALALFGGVDVKLPERANAEISCLPLFGGVSEPKNRVHDSSYPTVQVNAICLFGGIEIK